MLARKQNQGSRRGFTLIELLVVISIIGILASLILPAVVNARRQGRRIQCLNNMKNVGTGMFSYVTTKGKFPASGYWNVTANTNERQGLTPNVHPNSLLIDPTLGWAWSRFDDGVTFGGDPSTYSDASGNTEGLKYSWVVDMLPFIGAQNVYDAWDFTETSATTAPAGGNRGAYLDDTPGPGKRGNRDLANTYLEVLVCPEDVTAQQSQGSISYVVNSGFAPHWLAVVPTDPTSSTAPILREADGAGAGATSQGGGWHRQNLFNMGLMFLDTTQGGTDANRRHTLESVRDGVSFTAMLSENLNAGPGSQYGDEAGSTPLSSSWACPFPANTSFFVNPLAVFGADQIDGASVNVISGELGRYNYTQANNRGTLAPPAFQDAQGGINGDITGINEGKFPYPTSMHPGGVHVVMCDGNIRFIPENISGDVWSRIITPNGGALTRGNQAAAARINFETAPSGVTSGFIPGNRQVPLSESDIPSG